MGVCNSFYLSKYIALVIIRLQIVGAKSWHILVDDPFVKTTGMFNNLYLKVGMN